MPGMVMVVGKGKGKRMVTEYLVLDNRSLVSS